MVGIVVVTHGELAGALVRTGELILGPLEQVIAVGLDPNESDERMFSQIREAKDAADSGDGVLIMVDMFGGTPSNLALRFLDVTQVEVLTGVNLPMILKASGEPREALLPMAKAVAQAATRNIIVASEFLRNR